MIKKYGGIPNILALLIALLGAGVITILAVLASQYIHQ